MDGWTCNLSRPIKPVLFLYQVSELIIKLEAERNQLQEQLERASIKEAEVTKQVIQQ